MSKRNGLPTRPILLMILSILLIDFFHFYGLPSSQSVCKHWWAFFFLGHSPVVGESLGNVEIHRHGGVVMGRPGMGVAVIRLHHGTTADGGRRRSRAVVMTEHGGRPWRRRETSRMIQFEASVHHTAVHQIPNASTPPSLFHEIYQRSTGKLADLPGIPVPRTAPVDHTERAHTSARTALWAPKCSEIFRECDTRGATISAEHVTVKRRRLAIEWARGRAAAEAALASGGATWRHEARPRPPAAARPLPRAATAQVRGVPRVRGTLSRERAVPRRREPLHISRVFARQHVFCESRSSREHERNNLRYFWRDRAPRSFPDPASLRPVHITRTRWMVPLRNRRFMTCIRYFRYTPHILFSIANVLAIVNHPRPP